MKTFDEFDELEALMNVLMIFIRMDNRKARR